MLYDTIYEFFLSVFDSDYIENYSSTIMGVNTTLAQWLSHSATIVLLVLGIVWLILVIRWIFKVCSGLLKW